MMEPSLPDLLEALGELFLRPNGFDRSRFEALGRASWSGLGITPALQALVIQPAEGLDVAYAGLFLHGFKRPTLHLEASAHRTGWLSDPAVLQDLSGIYEAAWIRPDPAFQADHLGILLALLAHLLRELALAPRGRARKLECAARALLEDHLAPLAEAVAEGLEDPATHPLYRTAGHLMARCLSLSERILGRRMATFHHPTSNPMGRTYAP
jgi:TorA maturation chaperone TorD